MDGLSMRFADTREDEGGEGRWLTYVEISQISGIGRESAVKLVQREGWSCIPGNDGSARILVPADWLRQAERPVSDVSPGVLGEVSRLIQALDARFSAFAGQAKEAGQRAELAEAVTENERARAAQAEARARAADADRRSADERADAAHADRRAAEMRAESERARAELVEQVLTAERERIDRVREERDRIRAELRQADVFARVAAETAQSLWRAETVRRSKGRLARLLAAWRGE